MTYDLPPSYRRKDQPLGFRCDTCGDQVCKRKWKAHCWTHCGDWKPDPLLFGAAKIVIKRGEKPCP